MTYVARPIGADGEAALRRLLAAGGDQDAWMRHALREGGRAGFVGLYDPAGGLAGAALLRRGALCVARRTPPDAVDALVPAIGAQGPWYSVVGPEEPCGRLVAALRGRRRLRVDRVQVFMSAGDAAALAEPLESLRPATVRDIESLVPLVAAYRREDGLTRPEDDPSDWLRAHLRRRITGGHVFVACEDGHPVFTGAFNFRGPDGSGLGGIYTVPEARCRGFASRGTAGLARIGLLEGPVVTLHVDARNAPALRCYEKAGFARDGAFRLTFR